MRASAWTFVVPALLLGLLGCDAGEPARPAGLGADAEPATCAGRQTPHKGLDGESLVVGRVDGVDEHGHPKPIDRRRMKPPSALAGDLERLFGEAPALLRESEDAFGAVPERWYTEPQGSAVGLYTFYRVAFRACTAEASRTTAWQTKDEAVARAECGSMIRRFWLRPGTKDEIDTCTGMALGSPAPDAGGEAAGFIYACTALLTSADFLSY